MQKLSRAALALSLAMGVSGIAMASNPPATGLGEAWPNAEDVSASPHWHVYVFVLNGIKYVQVNDLNGNVVGAIGTAGGQFIALPMGQFSNYVSMPGQSASRPLSIKPASPSTTVYRDGSTIFSVTPENNGAVELTASTCNNPEDCQAG